MVNDRGSKKWISLMLPEHVEALKEIWEEDERKEKPFIDEHLMEEINIMLQLALKNDLTIELAYFKNHDDHKIKGKLLSVNALHNYLIIDDIKIKLDSVTGAWIE